MKNDVRNMVLPLPTLGCAAFAFLLIAPGTMQAQTQPQQFFACYVPRSGVVYRIKEPGLKDECTGKKHVQFSWAELFADNDGQVGIGTDNPVVELEVNGTVAASAFASASPLIFEAPARTERMRIDDITGNVGIGTTTPGAKLEVAGQVKITGGTPGAGKVLTSDAVGLALWETPSAGPGITPVVFTGTCTADAFNFPTSGGSTAGTIITDARFTISDPPTLLTVWTAPVGFPAVLESGFDNEYFLEDGRMLLTCNAGETIVAIVAF